MRGRITVAAALLALVSAASRVSARDLAVPTGKGWRHAATGITLRPTLGGLPRAGLSDITTGEWDVVAQFNDPAVAESVTVYIFQAATPDVAMWFDRAEYALVHRPGYRGVRPAGAVTAFALPGQAVAAGLRRVFVPAHGPYRSAAVAVAPVGRWLVTVRVSSTTLDPAALDGRMAALIAEIGWPAGMAAGIPAVPVAPCPVPLAFGKARVRKADMGQALIGSLIAGAAMLPSRSAAEPAGPVRPWCREGEATAIHAAYRRAGSDGYLLALGDAGRTIGAFPTTALPPSPTTGGFAITMNDVDGSSAGYPSFDALPRPEQVLKLISGTRPVTRTTLGRDGRMQVNIDPSAIR